MSEHEPSEESDRQMWEHQTVAALIVKARKLAGLGVQFDDGHNYLVPAEKLVDYATVLNACSDALEAAQAEIAEAKPNGEEQAWVEEHYWACAGCEER